MSDKSIIAYWPDFYRDLADFTVLADTEDSELELAAAAVAGQFGDQFVLSSRIGAVERREAMLGIYADPAVETLDFRKKRIINRYSTKPPFTLRYLQERLDFLVGAGRAVAGVDVQSFILTITTAIGEAELFGEVEKTVFAVKPANMIYRQQTAIGDEISLREHISYSALSRNTRLGTSWHLGVTPFAEPQPEVVVT